MSREAEDVKGYAQTIKRLEPDVHMIDPGAFYASAAISLKRIADFCTWVKWSLIVSAITYMLVSLMFEIMEGTSK